MSANAALHFANAALLVEESLAAQGPTVSSNVLTDGSTSQPALTARDQSDQAETAMFVREPTSRPGAEVLSSTG
jgi:hypothetical protein